MNVSSLEPTQKENMTIEEFKKILNKLKRQYRRDVNRIWKSTLTNESEKQLESRTLLVFLMRTMEILLTEVL